MLGPAACTPSLSQDPHLRVSAPEVCKGGRICTCPAFLPSPKDLRTEELGWREARPQEAVEGKLFPRRQWGVGKGDEQREEMSLTKEILPTVRRSRDTAPRSPILPIEAGSLPEGLNRGGQMEVS